MELIIIYMLFTYERIANTEYVWWCAIDATPFQLIANEENKCELIGRFSMKYLM